MADKIVATWTNDSVGITSQKIYRSLNEEPEVLLATLSPTVRSYVDNTFKDTDPYDVAYRVTSVGTVNGSVVEETTESLVVHIRRNIVPMSIVTTGNSFTILSGSPLTVEWEEGIVKTSIPYSGVPGIYQLTQSFGTIDDRNAILYNNEEGPIKGLYTLNGLKKVLNWYADGYVKIAIPNGITLNPIGLGAVIEEVPPTAPVGLTDFTNFFTQASVFNQDLSGWDMSAATATTAMFMGCTSFNGDIGTWDVSNVTNMVNMFADATAFNQPIGDWDLSNVTEITQMFMNASSFNQDLSDWNLDKITSLERVFKGASSFNGSINDWNVSNVINFYETFANCTNFNQPLNNWNMRSATTISRMFHAASSFNQDISSWKIGNVTSMEYTFFNATAFDQDLSDWCVPATTYTQFAQGSALQPEHFPVWGTCPLNDRDYVGITGILPGETLAVGESYQLSYESSVTSPTSVSWSLIEGSESATIDSNGLLEVTAATETMKVRLQLNEDSFYTTTITLRSAIRKDKLVVKVFTTGASSVLFLVGENTPVDWGDGSPVEVSVSSDISHVYPTVGEGAEYTVTIGSGLIPLSFGVYGNALTEVVQWPGYGWTGMQIGSTALVSVPNYLPEGATNLTFMFSGAAIFNDPNVTEWDTSNVTNMYGTFSGAYSFNQDISGWDTSNVTEMSLLFKYATAFNQPIGSWRVGNVQYMREMFNNASAFNQDLTGWCVGNIWSEPYWFGANSGMNTNQFPIWHTCPNGM